MGKLKFEDIDKYLKKWPIWVGLVLLFVSGIFYQLQVLNINLAEYSGLLIIIFLMISLAYSTPFLILALLTLLISKIAGKQRIEESDFLSLSFLSIIYFWAIKYLYENSSIAFFAIYFIFVGVGLILIIIETIVVSRNKKINSKNKKLVKKT